KLNNLVKSVQNTETGVRARDTQKAPTPFDTHTIRTGKSVEPPHRQSHSHRDGRSHARGEHEGHHGHDERSDRHTVASTKAHVRNDSGTIGVESAGDYASHQTNGRRHDYDVQSMETSLSNSRLNATKNPIPAPSVTVRSEFPTLNRSRQQQSLTCMITVEVVDGKWRADPADFRGPPSAASTLQPEEHCERPKSPAPSRQREAGLASVEDLRRITGDLHDRVDNWHGLDFKRFGRLILHATIRVGKDRQSWQDLECYLFSEMLICVKEKRSQQNQHREGADNASHKSSKCTLKGSILIKRHLKEVQPFPETNVLTLSLSVAELPHFHLQFHDREQLDIWRRALLNISNTDHHHRVPDYEQDNSGTDEDDFRTTGTKNGRRVSSSVRSSYGGDRSNHTAPTEYTSSRGG
ncbi:hypothetical protein LTR28_000219, partial [Elasticomyces elasticus]